MALYACENTCGSVRSGVDLSFQQKQYCSNCKKDTQFLEYVPVTQYEHHEIPIKVQRQESTNWCWIAVASMVAGTLGTTITQKDIFLKVAEKYAQKPERVTQGWDADLVKEFKAFNAPNLNNTTNLAIPPAGKSSGLINSQSIAPSMAQKFDKRGNVMDSLDAVGCIGKKFDVQNGKIDNMDAFEFVKRNVICKTPMIAHLKSLDPKQSVTHALLIIGTLEVPPSSKNIIWMDPDPKKTQLGTKNVTPQKDFAVLQKVAEWVAVTTTTKI